MHNTMLTAITQRARRTSANIGAQLLWFPATSTTVHTRVRRTRINRCNPTLYMLPTNPVNECKNKTTVKVTHCYQRTVQQGMKLT